MGLLSPSFSVSFLSLSQWVLYVCTEVCIVPVNKAQISCKITAQLISAFVFATQTVHFLFYVNPEFQASSFSLLLYRPVCVGPGWNLKRLFSSHRGSYYSHL